MKRLIVLFEPHITFQGDNYLPVEPDITRSTQRFRLAR